MKDEWIEDYLGVKTRHWVQNEAASDLGIETLKGLQIPESSQASLWVSTVSPDHFSPSTSSLIKKGIAWEHDSPAYDINTACTGLLSAIKLACNNLIVSQESEAVVIASEVRSKFLDFNDRKTVFLFGDGASSLWLTRNSNAPWEIDWIANSTFIADSIDVWIKSGGSRYPVGDDGINRKPVISFEDGANITSGLIGKLPTLIHKKLIEMNESIETYSKIIIHPGNKQIYLSLIQELRLPEHKTYSCLDKTGNVGSATVGIALSMLLNDFTFSPKSKILIITVGAGHHLAMMSLSRK